MVHGNTANYPTVDGTRPRFAWRNNGLLISTIQTRPESFYCCCCFLQFSAHVSCLLAVSVSVCLSVCLSAPTIHSISHRSFFVGQFVRYCATGERYDVVVSTDQPVANYWIRAIGLRDCWYTNGTANAILKYEGAGDEDPDLSLIHI